MVKDGYSNVGVLKEQDFRESAAYSAKSVSQYL